MANGDQAVAAGMDRVAGTDPRRLGFDEINLTRDYIAQRATRTGPDIDIYVQATEPAHRAGRVWVHPA